MKKTILTSWVVLFLAVSASADTIHLNSGDVITGEIISEDEEQVVVSVGGTDITCYSEDIKKIERGPIGDIQVLGEIEQSLMPEGQLQQPMRVSAEQDPATRMSLAMGQFKTHVLYGILLGYRAVVEKDEGICLAGEQNKYVLGVCHETYQEYMNDFYWAEGRCDEVSLPTAKKVCFAMRDKDLSALPNHVAEFVKGTWEDDYEKMVKAMQSHGEGEDFDSVFHYLALYARDYEKCKQYAQGLPYARMLFCRMLHPLSADTVDVIVKDAAFLHAALQDGANKALCPEIKDPWLREQCFDPTISSIDQLR